MVRPNGKFVFTFVRHPLSWYRSHWAWKKNSGIFEEVSLWHPTWQIDRLCHSETFELFVDSCLKHQPHYLSYLFPLYTGVGERVVDFVGKQETLKADLITALTLAGETFDEDLIQDNARTPNTSDATRITKATYTEAKALHMIRSEREALELYDYNTDLSQFTKGS